MMKILDELKPEAAYFGSQNGKRGGILIVDVAKPSDIPRLAEPWFSTNAEVKFSVVMTPEDLVEAKIADGEVPSFLADKRVLALDLSANCGGNEISRTVRERLKTIMKELMESQNSIVFIDELHTLVGAGSAEGSLDAANILKPALSRGEIQCIGATTPAEYRKSIEKDRSLERRFQAGRFRRRMRPRRSRSSWASRTATRSFMR